MDWPEGSQSTSSLLCQNDVPLPLSLRRTRRVHRRLPKRFRDILPEPPRALPPTELDGLVPSTPIRVPSMDLAHSSTESDPQAPSLSPDHDIRNGSDLLAPQTLMPRPRRIHETRSNSFGLFRCYDKGSLPAYDPEDTSDDITVFRSTEARKLATMDQLSTTENPFYPYPNETSLPLGDWYWNQSSLKSKDNFKRLLDIIGNPSFRPDDIRNTKWASIDRTLGSLTTDGDPKCSTEWLDDEAGWTRTSITISVPFSRRSANPGPTNYCVSDFYRRLLLSIIREQVLDPSDHHLFHYELYELLWQRSNRDIRIHGELYTLKAFLDAHCELLESPSEPGCNLPRRIVALMFWSDATQLTSFGDAKLWPLYLFFGNQTKYKRGQPSTRLCRHVAYFQTVRMTPFFKNYVLVNELGALVTRHL